jgi:hypothetical protein
MLYKVARSEYSGKKKEEGEKALKRYNAINGKNKYK